MKSKKIFYKIIALLLIITINIGLAPIKSKADSSMPILGEIKLFAGNFAPKGWAFCNGQTLNIAQNSALFAILGTYYGGNGTTTFQLPNLNGRAAIGSGYGQGLSDSVIGEAGGAEVVALTLNELPAHSHQINSFKAEVTGSGNLLANNSLGNFFTPGNSILAKGLRNERIYSNDVLAPEVNMKAGLIEFNKTYSINTAVDSAGSGTPHNNMQPSLGLNYIIALQGVFPSHDYDPLNGGSVIGEIKMFAGNFVPAGYYSCNGQTLNVADNPNLYTLIGETYGTGGISTFKLPDLQGRVPIGTGAGAGLTNRYLGEMGGTKNETLTTANMPLHMHNLLSQTFTYNETTSLKCTTEKGNTSIPENNVLANGIKNERIYSNTSNTAMKANEVEMTMAGTVTSPNITGNSGLGQPHNNMMPYLTINYIISGSGEFPGNGYPLGDLAFLGEIRMFAFNYAPANYEICQGQLLPIVQNQALFSILGTTYGGNGQYNFSLPDLRGRTPIGAGVVHPLGEMLGTEDVTLLTNQMPAHNHALNLSATISGTGTIKVTNAKGNTNSPYNSILAKGFKNERIYSTATPLQKMADMVNLNLSVKILPTDINGNAVNQTYTGSAGSNQAHNNMQPFTAITYAIAVNGIFPASN